MRLKLRHVTAEMSAMGNLFSAATRADWSIRSLRSLCQQTRYERTCGPLRIDSLLADQLLKASQHDSAVKPLGWWRSRRANIILEIAVNNFVALGRVVSSLNVAQRVRRILNRLSQKGTLK